MPAKLYSLRTTARIAEMVHARLLELVEPGLRKCDLVVEIIVVSIKCLPEAGGYYPAVVLLIASGAATGAPHNILDDTLIVADQGAFFEIGGCCRRYHAPLCRTIYFSSPPTP